MPVPELMTWVPSRRRWTRMHRSKRFWVSCRQLGTPETKADSIRAANAWWAAKQAELDAASKPVPREPLPLEDVASASLASKGYSLDALAKLIERDFVAERLRRLDLAPDVRKAVEALFAEPDAEPEPQFIERVVQSEAREVLADIGAGKALPEGITERLPPARVIQLEEASAMLRGSATPDTSRSVGWHVERWVDTQLALASAGTLAPDRADNNRIALCHFAAFLGGNADVSVINEARLHDYYLWCMRKVEERSKDRAGKGGWSVEYAKMVFRVARTFVRFLWESGEIELPRNLNSRGFRFNGGSKSVPTWTGAEVRHVIGEAPGQLKLHLLLMVNCGYTQADISDLLDTEVDWNEGRIVRKRSKTGDNASTPTVNYKLWPETFRLLQRYRSGTDRVLLTESGRPFVRKEIIGGKLVKADNIASNFTHLKRRLCFNKPLKQLRKTAATMLESHEVYGRFTGLFLGHAPSGMREKHYAAPPQSLFDEAVSWLGRELGFGDDAR